MRSYTGSVIDTIKIGTKVQQSNITVLVTSKYSILTKNVTHLFKLFAVLCLKLTIPERDVVKHLQSLSIEVENFVETDYLTIL